MKKKIRSKILLEFFICAVLLSTWISGCAVHEHSVAMISEEKKLYDDIMVKKNNQFLFADLGAYVGMGTRSSCEDELVSLESLLDRRLSVQLVYENKKITQIPFIDNEREKLVVLSTNRHDAVISDSLTIVKIFLIEIVDTLTGKKQVEVATMIPDIHCLRMNREMDISFLDKSVYSGLILYSDIEGALENIYVYGHGPIAEASVINDQSALETRRMYLGLLAEDRTRSDYEELEASICIGEKGDVVPIPSENDDFIYPDWDGGDDLPDSGCGDGGGGNYYDPDPLTKTLMLYAADGGKTLGSGEYPYNYLVSAIADACEGYIFSRWVGDLRGKPAKYSFQITSNVEATAYFRGFLDISKDIPCYDHSTGKANPLMEMGLAPSNKWSSNYCGATFGMTRNQATKFHSGMDLYAVSGTPVYAMYDGVISAKEKFVTGQPMRIGKNAYPDGYIGDKDGAGNRFSIDCTVGGVNVSIAYWHLNDVTPVVINPRTGKTFKQGDKVYRGELLGYTGRTGNAFDVDYPHLHLSVKKLGRYVDPEPYLNGSVRDTVVNGKRMVYSTQITGIKCDDDKISEIYKVGL